MLPYTAKTHCFAAFSALMQSAHDLVTSNSPWAKEPSQQVLRYKFNAIKQLRHELESTPTADDASLMSILFLAVLAGRLSDKSQRDVHRKALGKLVELRGGLHQVDRYVQSWLLQFEAFWTIETGHSILEKPANNHDGTPEIEDPSRSSISKLPSGFRTLVKTAKLSPKVVNALVRTNEYLNNNPKQGQLPADIDSTEASYNADPWDTVAHLSNQSKEEPTLDTLLHLGLLLFNYLALSNLPVWYIMSLWTNMGRWVRRELTQGLLNCVTPRRVAEERCLLWLSGVVVGWWRMARNELSIEGEMLATFAKRRFEQLFKETNGDGRATGFFKCERLCFDIAGYGPGGEGR